MKKILNQWAKLRIAVCTDRTVVDFYRKKFGVKIGQGCRILDRRLNLFGSEPYLIEIGDNVTITEGVRLVTHDGGVALFRDEYPGLNVYGRIIIRDNTFIGTGAIILPGVTIGPKAVIGAGSVVTRSIPPETVAAGVPARVLCTLDEYRQRSVRKGMLIQDKNTGKRQQLIEEFLAKSDQ